MPENSILFVNKDIIAESRNFTVRMNPPLESAVVMRADKPWEDRFIAFYLTVIDINGLLRMWYTCRDKEGQGNIAYAESHDGLTWEKPDLGIVDYKGSKKNNLVGLHDLEGSVIYDRNAEGGAEYPYRYFTSRHRKGIFIFKSRDGIIWEPEKGPVLNFIADSQNHVFRDSRSGKLTAYFRGWKQVTEPANAARKKYFRTVVRTELKEDFTHGGLMPAGEGGYRWKDSSLPAFTSEIPKVFECDETDGPDCDVYTMAVHQYPYDGRYYFAFPGLYSHFPPPPAGKFGNDGRIEIHLLGSLDGITWKRYGNMPYVPVGTTGSESSEMVFMGVGMAERGNNILQYGTGYSTTHGDNEGRIKNSDGVIILHKQRKDGFLSADSMETAGGTMFLKPQKIAGEKLFINYRTSICGYLKIGLCEADGSEIPGFSADDCIPLSGNSIREEVRWKNAVDVGTGMLKDRDVMIRVEGKYCNLYSILMV